MSRVVFIGNLPRDLTETQISEIFSEVGAVKSCRLVMDRETGKPKDHETAASAVRNLHNYEVNGRHLRVDYAEGDKDDAPRNEHNRTRDSRDRDRDQREERATDANLSNQNNSVQTITAIVKGMDPQQLAEVLAYLKVMIQSSPDQATTLLTQNPQLTFGVFQALITMNLVDAYTMQRILQAHPLGYQAPVPGSVPVAINSNPNILGPPGILPGANPNPIISHAQQLQLQEQQKQLVMQLINLTPQQIQELPAEQRQQVLILRENILAQQQQ